MKSGLWLPYQERIRSKKLAQPRDWREKEANKNLWIGTLNVGTMTRKGREVVVVIERKSIEILRVQDSRPDGKERRPRSSEMNTSCTTLA